MQHEQHISEVIKYQESAFEKLQNALQNKPVGEQRLRLSFLSFNIE